MRLFLGNLRQQAKEKELEGIKLILQLLDIEGATITIDAGGCHKEVAEIIRSRKADYIFGLKGNQGTLLAEVENFFMQAFAMGEDEWIQESQHRCLRQLRI
jgi:predicted transposase YbfD/YdcC